MKKFLTLVVALGVAVLFSSAALAGADCNYHKTQAAVDKAEASKDVAAAPTLDKTPANPNQTTQTAQVTKPAPEVKK